MATRLRDHCGVRLSVDMFSQMPRYASQYLDRGGSDQSAVEAWKNVQQQCDLLAKRLRAVRPLVIDHFLAWNKDLQPIGKLMIAAVILRCEAEYRRGGRNINNHGGGPDDWHRFIVHKLVYGCQKPDDLLSNKVRFITFNYDTSLEDHLSVALKSIDIIGDRKVVDAFLASERTIHVYGSVHKEGTLQPRLSPNSATEFVTSFSKAASVTSGNVRDFLDYSMAASEALRTIEPYDKNAEKASLSRAKAWIAGSDVIYILGYGFDENNSARLGLAECLKPTRRQTRAIMLTNSGDRNIVNKRASKLLFDRSDQFTNSSVHGNPALGTAFVEKSTRRVYDAFANDFDAFED